MDCKGIIREYLENNGFDGLFFPGECCCDLQDLIACNEYCAECQPGYKLPDREDPEGFVITNDVERYREEHDGN